MLLIFRHAQEGMRALCAFLFERLQRKDGRGKIGEVKDLLALTGQRKRLCEEAM